MNLECLKDFTTASSSPLLQRPWSGVIDGERWGFATNGSMLVAVRTETDLGLPEGGAPMILKMIAGAKVDSPRRVSLAALKLWAGPHRIECTLCHGSGTIDCDECDGSGDCSHCGIGECDECDGKGKADCNMCHGSKTSLPRSQGVIDGRTFNRGLIALALKHFSEPDGIAIRVGDEYSPLAIDGGNWRAVVMPLRGVDKADDPVFEAAEVST